MDFSYLLSKKNKIRKKIESIDRKFDSGKYWIPQNFENPSDCVFAGGDGSFNKLNYIDYCLYSIGAVSYINKVGEKIEKSISYWDTDIILPYKYVPDRLRLYMMNMELKTALWNFMNKDIDYYLFDGSIYSLLIQTHTYGTVIENNKNSSESSIVDYYNEYCNEIKDRIFENIGENRLIPTNDLNYKSNEERILFEQLEYIVLLTELLQNYDKKIIGVSKTSKMNLYFKEANIPDIAIFSKIKGTGYSKPLDLSDKKIKDINKNIYYTINHIKHFGYDIGKLYYQFVRLDGSSGMLNITSFSKLNNDFFSNLNEISVGGYPYILKKSHETVKIGDKDMELCAKLLGIYCKTDRDIIL
ncbi:DNA double-strand break repair nuclease NurA [Methanothermococcus okinawensis]|uniref:DNA double-strand break repair nuclease NurA n=1 Tax=Methanothermococcus okinawensis TaxID=155863 RepID=UPI00064F8078|nr:DNA double-strand break repair nuclease NurA [Methanothermococcus okinawensis]